MHSEIEIENLRSVYSEIKQYLNSHKKIWEQEVIQSYPNYQAAFDLSFIKSLLCYSDEELFKLSQLPRFNLIEIPTFLKEFDNLRDKIDSVIKINIFPDKAIEDKLPVHAFQNLNNKKRHEHLRIFNLLNSFKLIPTDKTVVDFCGGAGYLARNLAYYFNTSSTFVDINKELILRGHKRSQNYVPHEAKPLKSINLDILKSTSLEEIKNGSPFIGIHACAHLTDELIKIAVKKEAEWLLAVGCCYYKTEDTNYSISSFDKFNFSIESLVNASRGHDLSLKNFLFSQKVKRKRYLLHILLKKYLDTDFIAVGNCSSELYDESFETYANNRLEFLFGSGIKNKHQDSIKKIVNDEQEQLEVELLIRCNFIRTYFQELLEAIIAFDRMAYLLENNYEAHAVRLFDKNISPRNIAILGLKLTTT